MKVWAVSAAGFVASPTTFCMNLGAPRNQREGFSSGLVHVANKYLLR